MLILGKTLYHKPVMSLQTGRQIAKTVRPIINPADLQIVGHTLADIRSNDGEMYLLTQDIREMSSMGFIVDSVDELLREEDAIKLQDLLKLQFELAGMKVVDTQKKMLGKVTDYSFEPTTFLIQQLHVKPSFLQGIKTSRLLIHRKQIVEISNTHIVVEQAHIKNKASYSRDVFVNPFRQPSSPDIATTDNR
jgi:uncharacterized protein YrrD